MRDSIFNSLLYWTLCISHWKSWNTTYREHLEQLEVWVRVAVRMWCCFWQQVPVLFENLRWLSCSSCWIRGIACLIYFNFVLGIEEQKDQKARCGSEGKNCYSRLPWFAGSLAPRKWLYSALSSSCIDTDFWLSQPIPSNLQYLTSHVDLLENAE